MVSLGPFSCLWFLFQDLEGIFSRFIAAYKKKAKALLCWKKKDQRKKRNEKAKTAKNRKKRQTEYSVKCDTQLLGALTRDKNK